MKTSVFKTLAHVLCIGAALNLPHIASAQVSGNSVKIGFIDDLSGPYSELQGPGAVEAIKFAIADVGGKIDGKPIELVTFDHLNKADIAANKAREWFDEEGVDMIIGGSNSSVGLAISRIAKAKRKPYLVVGALTTRLTNEECTPYTVRYGIDTAALAKGTALALVKQGMKTWFFLTADYAFGTAMEEDASKTIKGAGGEVLGSVKHPLFATDFSSFLLQAKDSKAQVLALANAGADTVNAIKAADEFGVNKTMKITALLLLINDVNSLGLNLTQNMFLTDVWYWDQSAQTRQWAARFFDKMKRMPNSYQAAAYSAAFQYLTAVKAIRSDDADRVMAKLRSSKLTDMYVQNGTIRGDGVLLRDVYLMQVKQPSESKVPWDYLKIVQAIPGQDAFTAKADSKCALWK